MHTVHYPASGSSTPKNGFIAAAMGIMFSVNEHNAKATPAQEAIIDGFFDSLKWDGVSSGTTLVDQKSQKVRYGDLMMMVDMRRRWTYKGSVTTPPCATHVYWNVCKTIYPIKQKHLDQFKAQM
jgi:hypothetical protein